MNAQGFLKEAMEAAEVDAKKEYYDGFEVTSIGDLVEYLDYDTGAEWESEDHAISCEAGEFGGEGRGEHIWFVLSFRNKETDDMTYIRQTGNYSSWDGTNWDYGTIEFVKPKVVQRTEWTRAV